MISLGRVVLQSLAEEGFHTPILRHPWRKNASGQRYWCTQSAGIGNRAQYANGR